MSVNRNKNLCQHRDYTDFFFLKMFFSVLFFLNVNKKVFSILCPLGYE